MWVHPDWRGAGLGSRMLRHLEDRARDLGHRRVVLDTNATLVEAIEMYRKAGYQPVERYNDNPYAQAWFAKTVRPRARRASP
jgi:GNAT superfamily N-acetyltransferase